MTQLYGKGRWGCPLWEQMPDNAEDNDSVRNATETYFGRLVPLARAVRLENGNGMMVLANGLKFASYPEWREPTATVVVWKVKKGRPERALLRSSLDKAPWRELHSLTIKAISQTSNGGPLALKNVSDEKAFDIWVGGLVADKAKPLDTLESVFHVPATMLTDPGQRTYEAGVRYAEEIGFRLSRAVIVYHRELGDNLDRAEMREQRQRVQNKATLQFWTEVESHVGDLLGVVENPAQLGIEKAWHKTAWGQVVWRAALAAFDRACPHETARQIRAYALGRKVMIAAPATHETKTKA